MAVCVLSEKDGRQDWCARHQMFHRGHLAKYAVDPGEKGELFRRKWDEECALGIIPPSFFQKAKNYADAMARHAANNFLQVPPEVRTQRRDECERCPYRDQATDTCRSCGCELHPTILGDKLAWASEFCPQGHWGRWVPKNDASSPTRHLLFHLWPRKLSLGTWQRNLDHLKQRWKLFNGRKVIAVAVSSDSSPAEAVQEYMRGYDCEWIVTENDPTLREVKTFYPLAERVLEFNGKNHFTFYGQGKGVTKEVNGNVTVHRWTDAMYELALDYWDLTHNLLLTHPVVGSLKKNVPGAFGGSSSTWHYSGSFCWFNNEKWLSRDWRKIEQVWYGVESYPSMVFDSSEAGCLFFERNHQFNLYNLHGWGIVEEELRAWRSKHTPNLSDIG